MLHISLDVMPHIIIDAMLHVIFHIMPHVILQIIFDVMPHIIFQMIVDDLLGTIESLTFGDFNLQMFEIMDCLIFMFHF